MQKKYIVRLTDAEREMLGHLVKQRRFSAQKVRRAQVLLKADADGPNWPDTKIDGEQEAKIIALRLGQPPKGFANWSLRLLAQQAVALEIAQSISHETLRRALKKTA
jgi:hypothetical protein